MKEPNVVVILKCDAKVESATLLANPAYFVTVDKWVGDLGFNSAEIILTLWEVLKEGC